MGLVGSDGRIDSQDWRHKWKEKASLDLHVVSGGVINGWNMGELARGTSVGKAHQLNGEKSLDKFVELEMHDRDGRVIILLDVS